MRNIKKLSTLTQTSQRKADHIQLAFESVADGQDKRFYYEPMLAAHPTENTIPLTKIGNRQMKLPLWVSSMTGGSEKAGHINRSLAQACGKYGIGMGLGSCRIVLEDSKYFSDFDLRAYLGDEVPFMANLGIAQIENIVANGDYKIVEDLVHSLQADGLIIHVNPLQEWFQPEGDKITVSPIQTLKSFLKHFNYPIWVKEVGQGFGIKSLEALLELPVSGIEFGAYGGTNFAKLESLRHKSNAANSILPLSKVGHTADEMTEFINDLFNRKPQLFENKIMVVSGGIKNFLDGYYLINKLNVPAVYAQASAFLKHALEGSQAVEQFIESEKRGLMAAYAYLTVKK
ncbi:MAG: isopentenyl-diphosphate delta-isomerase [Bacteroidia bacterium]|nr:isopentenyl-diphosphate delta-isomerase [Bacteroidia bacterium]